MRLFVWAAMYVAAVAAARKHNVTVENDDPRLTYSPDSAWTTQHDTGKFSGGSLCTTTVPAASVSLVFNGSYVEYVADTGPQRGPYTVFIDGTYITTQSGSSATRHGSIVLFALALDPSTPHNITIVNAGVAPPNPMELGLDYFMFTTTDLPRTQPRLTTGNPPIGLVLGGTIGGAALVLSFVVLALVVAPPDPPQLFQPLPFVREPSTRRSGSRNDAYHRLNSRTPSPFRSDSDTSSRPHSNQRASFSQGNASSSQGNGNRSPSIHPYPLPNTSTHSSGRERNPFSSSSTSVHLGVPYANPFTSASHVDRDRRAHTRTPSNEIIPLQQHGRLPAGQGFICANCSVELARERTARMQNGPGSSSLRHLVASSGTGARR